MPQPEIVICLSTLALQGKLLRFRLEGPAITIGRASDNRVQLAASTVSRVHASLEWRGLELWLSDLGSRNGTWFNTYGPRRVRPCEPVRLLPGEDHFAIGPFCIAVFHRHGHHAAAPPIDRVRLTIDALVDDAGPPSRSGARAAERARRRRPSALVR